ncbi:hypothetical protein GCM10008967_00080 [Bacillus carboniphilus]|uniref:HTH cro/C1-type domain-containing protein n=1 Tax=Bacillus carboniphilus TaxID=86663 RepID=A0ABN0VNX8_9BACI
MAIGEEIGNARKRQGLTQEELSMKLPISRESISKYEKGGRSVPKDMRKHIAEGIDDTELYFATWNEAAGVVSIPFFNGEHIDQHPASMKHLVQFETNEALEQLERLSWVKPIHTRTDREKEEVKQAIVEVLDAAASMINLVAVLCREHKFSMKQIFKAWRSSLKVRRYSK